MEILKQYLLHRYPASFAMGRGHLTSRMLESFVPPVDMCPRLTSLNPRTTLRWCLAIVPFLINWRHRKVRMLGGSHSKWVIDSSLRQFLYSPISSNFPNFMYVQYIHLFVFIEYNSVTCVSLTSFCSFCNYALKIPNGFTQHHKDPSCHLP